MLFKWDETYEIGIIEIDNQHMELFETANKLFNSSKEETLENAKEVLDFLFKYVVNHFYIEESYQLEHNYPKYDEHKKLHLNFKKELEEMKAKIEANPSPENLEFLYNFVVSWLKEHILKADKQVGIHILNNPCY